MGLSDFLLDVGTWFIAIGLFILVFAGLLWCMAKLIELGERR